MNYWRKIVFLAVGLFSMQFCGCAGEEQTAAGMVARSENESGGMLAAPARKQQTETIALHLARRKNIVYTFFDSGIYFTWDKYLK